MIEPGNIQLLGLQTSHKRACHRCIALCSRTSQAHLVTVNWADAESEFLGKFADRRRGESPTDPLNEQGRRVSSCSHRTLSISDAKTQTSARLDSQRAPNHGGVPRIRNSRSLFNNYRGCVGSCNSHFGEFCAIEPCPKYSCFLGTSYW